MADNTNLVQFLDYAGLSQYDGLIKPYIAEAIETGVATSFKAVGIADGVLHFYTETPFAADSQPAYSVTLPKEDLSIFMKLVEGATEGNIASFDANGQVIDGGVKVADLATISVVDEKIGAAKTELNASITDNAEAIAKLNGTETEEGSVAKVVKDAKDTLQGNIDVVDDKADEALAGVESVNTKIGAVPEDKTVKDYIDEKTTGIATNAALEELTGRVTDAETAIEAIEKDYLVEADKTELQGNIDTVSGKVTTLIGDDADKSVRTIANEELAKQLIAEGAAESLDTLQEIAAWIQSHPDDASAMNKAISDLEALVGTLPEGITATTIVGYIQETVAAAEAHADELNNAMDARMQAVEGKSHEHTNKDEIDKVANGDVAKWNEAYSKAHEHANADELAKIAEGDVAKWNASEQNAKDYADQLNTAMDTRVKATEEAVSTVDSRIATAKGEATTYTDTEVAKDRERLTALENANKEGGAVDTAIKKAADAASAAQTTADEAKEAATTAQGEIDSLEEKVGTVEEGKTVVGMISEANAAIEAVDGRTTTLEEKMTAVEEKAAANEEAIADLAETHNTDKAALEASIAENAEAIANIKAIPSEKIAALFQTA